MSSRTSLSEPWFSSSPEAVRAERRGGERGCPSGGRRNDIIPLAPARGEFPPPGDPGGISCQPEGGRVHSLVKISSFSGKKSPFPSCVLRKFLLYCVHTSIELSDGNFMDAGIIWYDVSGNSQCLTTRKVPIEDGGVGRRFL